MKEKITLIYEILIVFISGIGLYLNFKLMPVGKAILYFTNISNILCFIFFLVIVILKITKKLKKNDLYYISKGMITMAITLTMIIFNMLLSSGESMGVFEGHMLECNIVHVFVPLLVIFDYIIFSPKGNLKGYYPYIWTLVLFFYQVVISIYSALGGTFLNGDKYPYYYMDVATYGIKGVLINYAVILVFYIGYGKIIQELDNKLVTSKSKK